MGYIGFGILFCIVGCVVGICFTLMGINTEKINNLFGIE